MQLEGTTTFSSRSGNKMVDHAVYRGEENVMQTHWGGFWHKSRAHLKTGWLITAGLIAPFPRAIAPRGKAPGSTPRKATRVGGGAPGPPHFSLRFPTRASASGRLLGRRCRR